MDMVIPCLGIVTYYKDNEYRKRINKYIVTFPNVSTIENTALAESE